MIITPYDTRACIGYVPSLSKISDGLKKAHLMNGDSFKVVSANPVGELMAVTVLPTVEATIKPFGHSITIKGLFGEGSFIYADARSMYSVDPRTLEVKPKVVMNNALVWTELRLKLQALWETPNYIMVQQCMDYPIMLYGKIMSEALARKYGLKPEVIARCDMLFSYAYWCFSHTEEDFKKADTTQLANLLAMSIRSTGSNVTDVIKDLEYFHTIEDVVVALKNEDVVGTQTMTSISTATLFEIAGSFWHITAGAPAQEIIACALEHPPTWMACIFTSVTNPSIRNNIDSVAQRYKRLSNPEIFINSLIHLVGDQ